MADIAAGRVRRSVDLLEFYEWRPKGLGLVATNGVQRTGVVTFGTTAVDILNELIEPGFIGQNSEIYFAFTQRFTEVKNAVGSLIYNIRIREETYGSIHAWVQVSPTLSKGIGSLANSEDTLSGYIDVGSLPRSPFRVNLQAVGLVASSMTGEVKNSSIMQFYLSPIPGA